MPAMKEKAKTKAIPKRRRTIFHLSAPDAGEVYLAGDFNNWDLRKHPMQKQENGVWKKTTMLFPGEYEYKFMVDGRWCTDPENDRMCWNRFGSQNNLIEVKPR
jgi:1,4-alpha-glucan branching enzyme